MNGKRSTDSIKDECVRCFQYNKCKRELKCIGALYNTECWTRAGTYADPPNALCMLLETNLVDSCDACSYFRLMKRLNETMDLANQLKEMLKNGTQ